MLITHCCIGLALGNTKAIVRSEQKYCKEMQCKENSQCGPQRLIDVILYKDEYKPMVVWKIG